MTETPKRLLLLETYEALTEKETFCIGERNFDEIRKIQAKKKRLLEELGKRADEPPESETERADFNARIKQLKAKEDANEALLETMMQENREQFRSLSKRVKSASQIRKAYGTANQTDGPRRSLKNKA